MFFSVFNICGLSAIGGRIVIKKKEIYYDLKLTIDGMGFVLYSDCAVEEIEEGYNYFEKEFATPSQVASHIRKGDVVGFNTGGGGTYCIKFRAGYPNEEIDEKYPISIRLAIDVKGGRISIIDLFWLMEWSKVCPVEQQIPVDDGIYHVTVSTMKPKSGIWGDNQEIYIFLNKIKEMPQLRWSGVPQLFTM
jgi:hypothetical protein